MIAAGEKIDTKQRILDTAGKLFATNGISGTSLRQIIAEAKVNLAAIHYHFQSKEVLLEALLVRRLEVVNTARLEKLTEYESNGRVPTLEEVLDAFMGPTVLFLSSGNSLFAKLMGRVHTEAADLLPKIFETHFQEFMDRFRAAFGRAAPHLPPDELHWRIFFSIGAMAYLLMNSQNATPLTRGICDGSDLAGASRRLVHFLAAGFGAPATPHNKA